MIDRKFKRFSIGRNIFFSKAKKNIDFKYRIGMMFAILALTGEQQFDFFNRTKEKLE